MKNQKRLNRRQMLKTIGAGTAAAALNSALSQTSLGSAQLSLDLINTTSQQFQTVKASTQVLKSRTRAFDLADVRLLESPFLKAQALDAKYLLQLSGQCRSQTKSSGLWRLGIGGALDRNKMSWSHTRSLPNRVLTDV